MKSVEDIFLKLEGNKNISGKFIVRYFHLIRDKKNIRWIVEDCKQLSTLLKDWRPFNKYSNFVWKIIILLHEVKLLRYIPISSYKKLKISLDFLNYEKNPEEISIAIYLGRKTPKNHKAIIFIFNRKENKCLNILKMAMNDNSWESVKKEYNVVRSFKNDLKRNIPKVYNCNKTEKYFVQEYINGKPYNFKIDNNHYNFLASLANENKKIDLKKLKIYLINQYKKIRTKVNEEFFLIKEIEYVLNLKVWDKEVQSVKAHGDFAPWNIKYDNSKNRIFVYDWEEYKPSFLPFYDLIYYQLSIKNFLNLNFEFDKYKYINFLKKNRYYIKKNYIEDIYLISKIFALTHFKLNKDLIYLKELI